MSPVFDPDEFAEWLTNAFEASPYKSWRAVARKLDTSHSTLSRLAGAKPQTINNKPSKPNPALVIQLAELFGKDVNEALIKGGHAPQSVPDDDGFFKGLKELPPDRQDLARRQIRAIIDSLAEDEETDADFDYVDDEEDAK